MRREKWTVCWQISAKGAIDHLLWWIMCMNLERRERDKIALGGYMELNGERGNPRGQ